MASSSFRGHHWPTWRKTSTKYFNGKKNKETQVHEIREQEKRLGAGAGAGGGGGGGGGGADGANRSMFACFQTYPRLAVWRGVPRALHHETRPARRASLFSRGLGAAGCTHYKNGAQPKEHDQLMWAAATHPPPPPPPPPPRAACARSHVLFFVFFVCVRGAGYVR